MPTLTPHDPLRRLQTTLARICPEGRMLGGAVADGGHRAVVGLSYECDHRSYQWDGRRRGGSTAHPFVTIQYTLDGWGEFQQNGQPQRVGPGQGFITTTPSDHRYGLPADSPGWTFAWMLFYLPYAVERLDAEAGRAGRVFTLDPTGPAMASFIRLFTTIAKEAGRIDPWEWERRVLDLTLHLSRVLTGGAGNPILTQVHAHLAAHPDRFIPVAELARAAGISRQRWTQRFRDTTGCTPAAYLLRLRIDRACHLLRDSGQDLGSIADACGFADANHLCKVFRRHLGLSPGNFRTGT